MTRNPHVLRRIGATLTVLATALFASATFAQAFPSKPLTLIVPWPVGGSSDLVLRSFAEAAGKQLGQTVVVENKPGASGTLGAVAMVNAKPDGYTLTQTPITVFRIPHLQKVAFHPINDLTYLIGLTGYTFGVVVRSDSQWKSFKDLIDYAKANPGKVSYGTPGAGTSLHITMEEIANTMGVKFLHVPFKGVAENIQGLLGGHIDVTADSTGWAPQVDSGRARLLVTWGAERTKRWPTVPTLKDLGFGIVSDSPFGIAGPKGMEPAVVKALHDAFRRAMDDPNYLKVLERYDQPTKYMTGEEYTAYARKQFEQDRVMMEKLGLKANN